ncbi:Mth938-like domain-containing protein [Reyranella sp.]|uniref:Mth938-like domain-containing protein n=1 Tax=Reyranella sp. TaxID=1929291 RepID=UPI003D10AB33
MKPPLPGPADKTLPTPDPAQVQYIRSYGPGRFMISDREWQTPVLVTPTITHPWEITRIEDLSLDSLAPLREAAIPTELLVLGCGARAVFVPPDLRATLKAAGMGLEVVDTGSACRIYNVLLAEGRRVAAALIPL